MDMQEILDDARGRMDAAVDKVREDFAAIRTGRANPQLVHGLTVDYYGTRTPLRQLANFSVPEPRILLVQPYDPQSTSQIEKTIREANLGLNPHTDGSIVRCVFPELTEERRHEFIRLARQRAEDGRIAVRNIRRDAKDHLERLVADGEVGEDDQERAMKQLEQLTAQHVGRIDELLEHKEEDLLEV